MASSALVRLTSRSFIIPSRRKQWQQFDEHARCDHHDQQLLGPPFEFGVGHVGLPSGVSIQLRSKALDFAFCDFEASLLILDDEHKGIRIADGGFRWIAQL